MHVYTLNTKKKKKTMTYDVTETLGEASQPVARGRGHSWNKNPFQFVL